MCHLSNKSTNDKTDTTTNPHYACPRCHAAYCELPVECNVCGLTLVAAPHLARAYHHLFPLDLFESVNGHDSFSETSLDNQEKSKETIDSTDCTTDHQPRVCFGCNVMIPLKIPVSYELININ
ncbi:unnamed protein product [Schistosoma mattheei]|uniref:Uncharacterized protein n=1 Tax=Schistosoma mattheei TaxID=31246 RepID=A0A183NLG4_9TREM|nr:unnamed protein product [Schistosoma mattheei]